ncbi:MAG: ComF family protein [Bacteroidota bacterium]|nr:ComF family protein [Bacteroidota bacterium]
MRIIFEPLKDFFNLIYPNLCVVCNNHLVSQEKLICTSCLYNLPKTNFHLDIENPVSQLFWGRTKIEYATSFYFYHKGSKYQKMMHKFKYHDCKEIGFILGRYFGSQLKDSVFNQVDLIVPVPLHKSKLKKRGYNQSEFVARGLSESLEKEVDAKTLIRSVATSTQTRKSRFERWKNVERIFDIKEPERFRNKHILLVDDVVTTGSTLEACANTLLEVPETKVSIATLAVA